jgi:hypothetical protein
MLAMQTWSPHINFTTSSPLFELPFHPPSSLLRAIQPNPRRAVRISASVVRRPAAPEPRTYLRRPSATPTRTCFSTLNTLPITVFPPHHLHLHQHPPSPCPRRGTAHLDVCDGRIWRLWSRDATGCCVCRKTEREARRATRPAFEDVRVHMQRTWAVLCVYLPLSVDVE